MNVGRRECSVRWCHRAILILFRLNMAVEGSGQKVLAGQTTMCSSGVTSDKKEQCLRLTCMLCGHVSGPVEETR
jgi:hypothetical protein